MFVSEEDEYALCGACKNEVSRADRVYLVRDVDVLCFDCARERHGVYHELLDRWTVAPQVADLL